MKSGNPLDQQIKLANGRLGPAYRTTRVAIPSVSFSVPNHSMY